MGRREFLLSAVVAVSLLAVVAPAPAVASESDCPAFICGEFGNGGVDLSGTIQIPGSPGSPGSGGLSGGAGGGSGSGGGTGSGPVDSGPCPPSATLVNIPGRGEMCLAEAIPTVPGEPGDGSAGTPALPPVTLSAIQHFRAEPPQQRMEPDGWTIAGLHTNIYAVSRVQVVSGSLFGTPADVRFTPVTYHWDYGDATRASLTTPGASWSSLGVAEFGRTPTSHVYAERGDYVIRLHVDYTAEYRYSGSAWYPIPGLLTLPANELRITAGGAQTVLVGDHCLARPSGPGC